MSESNEVLEHFANICTTACERGWHEANGGNLSCVLEEDEVAVFDPLLQDGGWHALARPARALSNKYMLITASGSYLSHIDERSCGIVALSSDGTSWQPVWGFEGGTRPSSELETHLAAYEASVQNGMQSRVIYHAHAPHAIALSAVIDSDSRTWSRVLWKVMTESIIVFPEGLGAIPWMVPGSPELAQATVELMGTYKACVWAHHGIMARAATLDEAFGIVDTVEKAAAIYLEARAACGGHEPEHLVTDDELRALCVRYDITPNEAFL